jgi:RNA polymerase sigma factor (sigma-70 family)
LELTPSQKKTVRHQFDSFCRKILREEARDYIRELSRLAEHEVSLSELSEEQMERLYVMDEYPSEQHCFDVQGYHVMIRDDRLAEALSSLSDEKRDIVLLAYCLDMSDREIGEKLNMVRCTVQRRRTSSIAEMRKRMGDTSDGKQSD